MNTPLKTYDIRFILPLGFLAALAPVAIDMYLPALPELARELNASEGLVQFSVMSFFVGITLGQLFYGPLSDRIGRKPAILIGITLFILASIACALAQNAMQLIGFRFIEGLGGSIGMSMSVAMIRDRFTGHQAARLMAFVLLVLGVAPVLAPSAGTAVLHMSSWRMIFIVIAAYGAFAALMVTFAVRETLSPERRRPFRPLAVLANYAHLIGERHFILFVLVVSLIQASFFAYLAASAFIFISLYGLSPAQFSLLFAVNAAGLIGAAQISPTLLRFFSPILIIRIAVGVHVVCGLLLVASQWIGLPDIWLFASLLFISIAMMGIVGPAGAMMAMQSQGAMAGTAAALMGTFQFGFGAASSAIVGALADGSARPLAYVVAGCGLIALLISTRLPSTQDFVPPHS